VYSAWQKFLVADISLGASVIATGAAIWFFLRPPGSSKEPRSALTDFGVGASGQGFNVSWAKRF
jgi:hypothetical protein